MQPGPYSLPRSAPRYQVRRRPRRRVLTTVLGTVVLLTGTAFVLQSAADLRSGGSSGTGVRPVLVQQVRPGAAYRYGPAGIYNACALLTLDDLRERGLSPAPDQYLDEYYPVADQPALAPGLTSPETAPINLTGPSNCGVFLQRGGHVGVEVLQAPYYNDPGFRERDLPRMERTGTTYQQDGLKVVVRPPDGPTPDWDYRTAQALVLGPTAVAKITVGLENNADPSPVLNGLVETVAPRLSAPPSREMELSYSPSGLDGPDACDVLRKEDIQALLGSPPTGFAIRRADLAENLLFLGDGTVTYFTSTTCEREPVSTGFLGHGRSWVHFTLRTYHDTAHAEATMRQRLDPQGSSFGPPVVLPVIGDDPGAVTPPVLGDRKVVFRVGRHLGELDYRDDTESAESPEVLAERVPPVARAIANRLRG